MAGFDLFAKRIRKRAQEVETGARRKQRRAALAINQTVILETPVLTGHARANWQVGLGVAQKSELDEEDKSGGPTIGRNRAEINRSRQGKAIFISNNVPYINELNAGSSAKAPAMFVQIAVQEALSAVARTKVFR